MPTRNAFATARLNHRRAGKRWKIQLQVWCRSYDHPNPDRRSALVTRVEIVDLPPQTGYDVNVDSVTDRYGVDHARLWTLQSGAQSEGFDGYSEFDTAGSCGEDLPSVFWSAFTGIYDERCLADEACDARRLQTFRPSAESVAVYNYLIGPVTFSFSLNAFSADPAVRLTLGHIGGNGGDPTQRSSTLPAEEFVIRFP